MNKIQYQKEVVAEIQRISKKLGNTITLAQYGKHCQHEYRHQLIKCRLDARWNELKIKAGVVISDRRGSKKAVLIKPKITDRICNMCENTFKAKGDMRSCPSCTNLKNISGGYVTGMDERNLGYIG